MNVESSTIIHTSVDTFLVIEVSIQRYFVKTDIALDVTSTCYCRVNK